MNDEKHSLNLTIGAGTTQQPRHRLNRPHIQTLIKYTQKRLKSCFCTGLSKCFERSMTSLQKRGSWLPGKFAPLICSGVVCLHGGIWVRGGDKEVWRRDRLYTLRCVVKRRRRRRRQTHTHRDMIMKWRHIHLWFWFVQYTGFSFGSVEFYMISFEIEGFVVGWWVVRF